MATNAPEPTTAWDESQCTAALAHLERLKTQIDSLRLTIPRIIEPFTSPPTPAMFRAFSDNLTTVQTEVKGFKTEWNSQETRTVLEHASNSLKQDGDLSRSAEVAKYGWVDRESREKKRGKKAVEQKEVGGGPGERLGEGDIGKIVDEWKGKEGHEKIGLKRENGDKDLTVGICTCVGGLIETDWRVQISFVAGSWKHRFHVVITQKENEAHKIDVECLGTRATELAITGCIKARPKANDLRYLLVCSRPFHNHPGKTAIRNRIMPAVVGHTDEWSRI